MLRKLIEEMFKTNATDASARLAEPSARHLETSSGSTHPIWARVCLPGGSPQAASLTPENIDFQYNKQPVATE